MSADLTSAVDALTSKMDQLFGIPDASDFAALWGFGFGLPVSVFLLSWAIGKLLAMFKEY